MSRIVGSADGIGAGLRQHARQEGGHYPYVWEPVTDCVDQRGRGGQRGCVAFDDVDQPAERPDGQAAGMPRGAAGREHVVRSGQVVAERDRRIVAYGTLIGFFGHMVGESNADVQALIANADTFLGPGILVPTRNAGLFRWCLENGLRVVQPMTLMTLGFYNEPAGAYLPSILY